MATLADLDRTAMALPGVTRRATAGRPSYYVLDKLFCCHRGDRPDALDPATGERLSDVLMLRVADESMKDMYLRDERGVFFTTPHFDGYDAILIRIGNLAALEDDELFEIVSDAWLTRAPTRVAAAWLREQAPGTDE